MKINSIKKRYLVYGASGHGKVIIESIEKNGDEVLNVYDDNENIKKILSYPVIVKGSFLEQLPVDLDVIIAIGDNRVRKRIAEKMALKYGTVLHPGSNISQSATIADGTVIMAGAVINSSVFIGKHCIINSNASIDHDCFVSDFVHISPGVVLAGNVSVGEGSHIGIGSTVIQDITIGKWATIGAGAVVIRDVPDYAVLVGVPAKIIKYNNGIQNEK